MTRTGSESAFAAIYERYEPDIYAYCRRRFEADVAEDVASDVFATAWRKFDTAPDQDQILPWLYRIAYLTSSNHRRSFGRRRRLGQILQANTSSSTEGTAEQIVMRDELRRVLHALEKLTPADQEVLRLSVWEELTAAEIASVLDISPEAAAQRLHRARGRLTRVFDRMDDARAAAKEGGGR